MHQCLTVLLYRALKSIMLICIQFAVDDHPNSLSLLRRKSHGNPLIIIRTQSECKVIQLRTTDI